MPRTIHDYGTVIADGVFEQAQRNVLYNASVSRRREKFELNLVHVGVNNNNDHDVCYKSVADV